MSKRQTIMVVDDDADIRQSIQMGLEEGALGVKVITAHNALTALQLAKTHKPDVIILDLHMPGGTGFEFMEELRQDPQLATTKVLLLTARASRENMWESIDKNIDDFMAKPFDFMELETRVKNLLAKPTRNSRRI